MGVHEWIGATVNIRFKLCSTLLPCRLYFSRLRQFGRLLSVATMSSLAQLRNRDI